mmetsp:Transcript_9893/g.13053  ORF Transcript_9893/g.13053 Transcript_9893/m.13053 type:complete len:274 (+) Transcript_9893:75-896(+)|eukprot:CAMPEP_0198142130 /NCGR_PEP_ID=MMETSP1443-20131203/5010_1 /TAXON_ID=186043 /ORGANISM="Entomoneis sp., Strain CCMP2396" /LENGTH=273 /DNA_ID=CAMNT_0043805085 /DNA_START=105 /DNA_END=926 /DNA_ORIENTATION=+
MRILINICLVISTLSVVAAGPSKPELYLNVNSDSLDKGFGIGVLEPTVKWQTSGSVAECDVEGGLSMSVTDDQAMPYSLWGRIKKNLHGVDLSARVDTKSSDMNLFDLDVQAEREDTYVQFKGKANAEDSSVEVNNVQLSQKLSAPGGYFTITPKYDIAARKADVQVSYGTDVTVVTVDANADKQKVTVSQEMGDNIGSIKPSITTEGDIELQYSRKVGTGSMTAKYKPNDSAEVVFNDGPWEVTVTAPMDTFDNFGQRLKFNLRRSVDVSGE